MILLVSKRVSLPGESRMVRRSAARRVPAGRESVLSRNGMACSWCTCGKRAGTGARRDMAAGGGWTAVGGTHKITAVVITVFLPSCVGEGRAGTSPRAVRPGCDAGRWT